MKYFNKSQELQKIDNECDKLVEIELFNKKFFFCLYLRKRCWLFSAWEKGTLEEKETMDFVVAELRSVTVVGILRRSQKLLGRNWLILWKRTQYQT